jgi:hypothetical protein
MTNDKLTEALAYVEKDKSYPHWEKPYQIVMEAARSTLTPPDTQGALDDFKTLKNLCLYQDDNHRISFQKVEEMFDSVERALTRQPVVTDTQGLDALKIVRDAKEYDVGLYQADACKKLAPYLELIETALTRPSREAKLLEALKKIRDGMPTSDEDYYEGGYHQYRIIAEQAIAEYEEETK